MQKFLALCHLKNELNRRRRRFWYWANVTRPDNETPFSHAFARRGYAKAKADMKAMTKEMSELRKACGAKVYWNWSGGIDRVIVGEQKISYKLFKKFWEMEEFEVNMLTDKES